MFWAPATRFLVALTSIAFLLQVILDLMTGYSFTPVFALSWVGIRHLALWQPVTYMFLHGGFWHLFFNMLGLFFLGPETERVLGRRRFTVLYLVCGILGGLGWLLFSGQRGICVGASGAVLGILAAFAALFPNRPVTLLVFFVIPVTMRARTMALGFGVATLLMMFGQPGGSVAHAAHLAGGLAGWLYVTLFFNRSGTGMAWNPRRWWHEMRWRWERRNFKVVSRPDNIWNAPPEPPADAPTEAEVDAILEKISRYGLNSLTDDEREILQRASRR